MTFWSFSQLTGVTESSTAGTCNDDTQEYRRPWKF